MSKFKKIFDFCEFDGDFGFAVDKATYSKEEAVELAKSEAEYGDICDVFVDYVRYTLDTLGGEYPNGCYTGAVKGERGSFPVWIVKEDK